MQGLFCTQMNTNTPNPIIACCKEADLNEKGFVVNAHLFDSGP